MQSASSSPWSVRTPFPEVTAVRRTVSAPAATAQPKIVAAPDGAPPDWIREARRKYTLRLRDWATQAWAMTHSPHRFMQEWMSGQREALNPLRFLAVGLAATFLVDKLFRRLLHLASPATDTPGGWLNTTTGTTLYVILCGAAIHGMLRWRSRAELRSSLAATMFATSGPAALLSVAGWIVCLGIHLAHGNLHVIDTPAGPLPLVAMAVGILALGWPVAALAAVHRMRWWWPLLALLGVYIAGGIIIGLAGVALRRLHWI
jgi:hypothetical protein